jgi:hypothetical protein
MTGSVSMGSWVQIDSRDIRYIVPRNDETVEFYFGGNTAFTANLTGAAIERCIEIFPVALAKLREQIAADEAEEED